LSTYNNYELVKAKAKEIADSGTDIIFTSMFNNNTRGIIDGISGSNTKLITLDNYFSYGSQIKSQGSVNRNNSKVIYDTFRLFNETGFVYGGFFYGISEDAFYATSHPYDPLINNTVAVFKDDIISSRVVIQTNQIKFGNTPGFTGPIAILAFLGFVVIINYKKKRR